MSVSRWLVGMWAAITVMWIFIATQQTTFAVAAMAVVVVCQVVIVVKLWRTR